MAAREGGAVEEPEEEELAPASAPIETMKLAEKESEVLILKRRLDERDQADRRNKDVKEALERLAGRPMGADLEKELLEFHQKHGPDAFLGHVEGYEKYIAEAEGITFAAKEKKPTTAVEAYIEMGPEAANRALGFSKEYHEMLEHGLRPSTDEAGYLKLRMERDFGYGGDN